jgi:hypothetical protein
MTKQPSNPAARTWFALGCAWTLLIVIVLAVAAVLLVMWRIGLIGPADA